ncbi:MAG: DUF1929 domain-containing protein [Gemmatimonadales bacterium]|nr:DUF1929 domain-containing protein [Gemmatimonadales bacterium]
MNRQGFSLVLGIFSILGLGACEDGSQAPRARSALAESEDAGDEGTLAPLDLVYICGNKFLATNATRSAVRVTYRVAGTDETGSLTLREGRSEDEGFSETELETRGRGEVELYLNDQRVARRRNRGMPCGPSSLSASVAAAAGEASGEWSAQFPWPITAVHLSLLPDGRVLSWGESGTPQLWNPASGLFTSVPSPALLFCAGHSFLGDGRLLVSGGHISEDHGLPDNTLFAPHAASWSSSTPMRRGRWYPTNTTMGNGDVAILAGRDQAGAQVSEPEVWTPNGVRVLEGAARVLPYYPRAFLAPNGKLFYAGQSEPSRYLDLAGTGSWTTVAYQLYGSRSYGAAVMYDVGKVLYVGGGRTTNTAETIDLNFAAPAWQWTGSMAFPRRHLNATVLPTGEVLATGGSSGTGFNDFEEAVHPAELWSPTTGTWTTLAGNSVKRAYHSTSILLPDGRVLHTGSGNGGGQLGQRNAELFSPPYLFKGPPPTITEVPARVGYGASFTVATPEAGAIAKVSLVRLGSTTHAFDMNQRFQPLSFNPQAGGLVVSAPSSRNHAPPGDYMLFILDTTGVPSVARFIRVGSGSDPGPTNTPPKADFSYTCSGLACSFTDRSTDVDGGVAKWSWAFGDGASSAARNPRRTYAAPGTYQVTLTVTDTDGAVGQRSSSVTVSAALPISLTVSGRTDSVKHYITYRWSGATGTMVDLYRNGRLIKSTPNDGRHITAHRCVGAATYRLKVCLVGTTTCSNEATLHLE